MDSNQPYYIHLPNALLKGISQCLEEIIFNDSYSDKAVANMLKSHKSWGSRDRRTATAIIYDISRNLLKYQFICERVELFQSQKDKIKDLVAISLYFNATYKDKLEIDESIQSQIEAITNLPIHLTHSLQEWLYNALKNDWGKKTASLLSSLDEVAPVYIRINPLKSTIDQFQIELEKLKIEYQIHPEIDYAIEIKSKNQLRHTKVFNSGFFEFQDIGSQYIIHQCDIQPEQTVIDFCAGKGGKTLQLAALMNENGKLIASDIDNSRLEHLERRAKRAGITFLEILPNDQLLKMNEVQADIVFIDAPCTGTGTLRRQADIKFRLKEADLKEVLQVQSQILEQAHPLLHPNGKLIYATCSVLKSENEKQIESFLKKHNNFRLVSEEYILPEKLNSDSFYMAILERTDN